MIRRLELMKWLNTCPDRNWDIVHEDEGHMRVLFVFDEEQEHEEIERMETLSDLTAYWDKHGNGNGEVNDDKA